MVDSFKYILQETPLAWAIVGGGALSTLLALLVILLAARRGRQVRALRAHLGKGAPPSSTLRFGVALEVPAAASMLLVPALAVAAIALARAQLLAAVTQTDPSQKATFLAMGIAGQLNAICLGGMLVVVQVPLAALALGLALGYRVQAAGLGRAAEVMRSAGADSAEAKAWLQHPGPGTDRVLLVALATAAVVAFVAMGFLNWATHLIASFSAVAGVDPAQKGVLLLAGMDEARVILERIPLVAAAAVVGVTVVAVVVLHVLSAARARLALAPSLPAAPGLSWRAVAAVSGPCLVGAAACLVLVGPYRAENLSPLPVQPVVGGVVLSGGVATPEVQGPDRVDYAPLLTVARAWTRLDHSQVESPRALVERLEVQRNNYKLIHPDRKFPGEALLEADRDVRYKTLQPWLAAARQAGYPRLTLAFSKQELLRRPLLGVLPRKQTTGARVTLVTVTEAPAEAQRLPCDAPAADLGGGKGAVLLEAAPNTAYAQLARAAVAARRAGRKVVIVVPAGDESPQ